MNDTDVYVTYRLYVYVNKLVHTTGVWDVSRSVLCTICVTLWKGPALRRLKFSADRTLETPPQQNRRWKGQQEVLQWTGAGSVETGNQ